MSTATVTTHGRITLPNDIRDALGIRPGDRVELSLRPDGVVELTRRTRDLLSLAGMLKWDGPPVSVEAMDDAVGARLTVDRALLAQPDVVEP